MSIRPPSLGERRFKRGLLGFFIGMAVGLTLLRILFVWHVIAQETPMHTLGFFLVGAIIGAIVGAITTPRNWR